MRRALSRARFPFIDSLPVGRTQSWLRSGRTVLSSARAGAQIQVEQPAGAIPAHAVPSPTGVLPVRLRKVRGGAAAHARWSASAAHTYRADPAPVRDAQRD